MSTRKKGVRSVSKPRYIWWGYVKAAIHACGNPRSPKHGMMSEGAIAAYERMAASLPEARRQLMLMVLVRRTHTLAGAALKLHISEPTAQRWHRSIIMAMARELKIDTQKP